VPANNVIVQFSAQTGPGPAEEIGNSFTPTWTIDANNSLIAGQPPASYSGNFSLETSGRSVGVLTAGGSSTLAIISGMEGRSTSTNYVTCGNRGRAGSAITYALKGSETGFDLTNITVYGGWGDGNRDQQAYTVYYSTVAAPEIFIGLASVEFNPDDPANTPSATRVSLVPAQGALARNVAAVKFDFARPASKNGYAGYCHITLSGSPSSELSSAGARGENQMLVATKGSQTPDDVDLLGSWIWDAKTYDGQTCQFWRTFDIPANSQVTKARLLITADNEFIYFLDGRELGRGVEWRDLFDYNLISHMSSGRHVLAVKGYNSTGPAGVLLGLRMDLADGRFLEIKSDASWKIVPNEVKGWQEMTKPQTTWPAATIVGEIGSGPRWTQPDNVNTMLVPPPARVFFWQSAWFQITFLVLSGLLLVAVFFLAAQLLLHQKERWLLQRERARIAMDIHDDIGSRITQLVLNGEDVQEELPEDSAVRRRLEEVWDDARRVLSSIDEILWALNPRLDTLRDFADYICDYAHKFLEPSGIQCIFEVAPNMQLTTADLPLRRSLLMAIKETLNNIVKHSGATEVRLKIEQQRQHLIVVVQDNGKGFDPAAAKPGRNGLVNLLRRMRELGGSCQLTSQPGKGCHIAFNIPLTRPKRFYLFKR